MAVVTTLLRVIAGRDGVEGEQTKIFIAKDMKTAFLLQEPLLDENASVLETIFDSQNPSDVAVRDYEAALQSNDGALPGNRVFRD